MTPSGEFGRSSTVSWYYRATAPVVRILAAMFRTLLPDVFKRYHDAFEAGIWELDDPGPWLGRAIIYKLQTKLHRDQKDAGPTVGFPVNSYSGGSLQLPDLMATFMCVPPFHYICA